LYYVSAHRTTTRFFDEDVFKQAATIDNKAAKDKITAQVLKINPTAQEKNIAKFISG